MKLDIAKLNKIYSEAESCDSALFAEQRSNILLVAGDHYTKKGSRFLSNIRDSKALSDEQKLRITKNHIQKIAKTYVNNITSYAPGVGVKPNNESELQDQKAAELHHSVLQHLKKKHKLRRKIREWAEDYINIGEVAVKVWWNPMAGEFLGYKAELDPITGQNVIDPETCQPKHTGEPVFSGDLVFERVFGFNLLRAPEAESMDASSVLIFRKMVATEDLKALVGDDEEKLGFINATKKKAFTVFEGQDYRQVNDQTLLKEYYFRQSPEFPNGYFVYATSEGILFEGELPFGLFPIKSCGFDELETSPRSRSIIKQLRPYQVEVNRSASKIAEHQITLGDDKLILINGSKVTNGGQQPGVRAYSVNGAAPTILPGRSGAQYLDYMNSQIDEMYKVANVFEDSEEKDAQLDPYALLFRTIRHKKRFSLYAEKFEQFLVEVHELGLELYRQYVGEAELIEVIGKCEVVNIAEFKNAKKLGYQITLDAQSDDIETKMGKMLSLNHVLQYASGKLSEDAVGKIVSVMPYLNEEEAFGDLTMDYKNATNDILALDRGEKPHANEFDNHKYLIKRLTQRMKQSDFRTLAPQVQDNYRTYLDIHEGLEADVQRKLIAAKSEYIPTGGYFVVCDYYVPNEKDPLKKDRVKVPADSIEWLIKQLQAQGVQKNALLDLPEEAQAHFASVLTQPVPYQQPGPTGAATPRMPYGN
jgi:DNA polymerase III psi subunit